jgi:hypothetical protein
MIPTCLCICPNPNSWARIGSDQIKYTQWSVVVKQNKFRSTRSLTTRLFQWFYLFFLGYYQFLSFSAIQRPMDRHISIYSLYLHWVSANPRKSSSPRWHFHINFLLHPINVPEAKDYVVYPMHLPTNEGDGDLTLSRGLAWRQSFPLFLFSAIASKPSSLVRALSERQWYQTSLTQNHHGPSSGLRIGGIIVTSIEHTFFSIISTCKFYPLLSSLLSFFLSDV